MKERILLALVLALRASSLYWVLGANLAIAAVPADNYGKEISEYSRDNQSIGQIGNHPNNEKLADLGDLIQNIQDVQKKLDGLFHKKDDGDQSSDKQDSKQDSRQDSKTDSQADNQPDDDQPDDKESSQQGDMQGSHQYGNHQ
jgi:hypothetical protein